MTAITSYNLIPVVVSIVSLLLLRTLLWNQGYSGNLIYDIFLPFLFLFHLFWGVSLWLKIRRLLAYSLIFVAVSIAVWLSGTILKGILWTDIITTVLLATICIVLYRSYRSIKAVRGFHFQDLPVFG